ncbi:Uncharacterized protein Rs2_42962 [Raphanus sativus]|uniref:Uncharacterized protein LOC108835813 n=1 Tax=Raphanus sativus TaxID=3726 RepID=A0A6J0LXI8_RAPSA|nr:uncharacterized protein LOC108835813 [Raphanus sativus]KAJ4877944.1 Uncharacterized protein Rs2_42962 [Raphanus sativus]
MKDRGKRTATERRNDDISFYYSTPSDLSCRKHPSVSAVGICPYCLNDRLVNLVCSECGEHRLSSCSCSDVSPNRTSNAARISSFIDEEATKQRKETEKSRKTEEVVVFKRSSSSCVEISKRKHHRFSRIGRFLRKINLVKETALDYNNNDGKKQGVSRTRSLCSFRGGKGYFFGSEEDVSSYSGARSSFSAAGISSVNGGLGVSDTKTEHRKSNFEGRKSNLSEKSNFEGRKSNFSETTETRRSNFSESEPPRRSCFDARKSNFSETEYRRSSNFSETEYTRRENDHPRRSNYEAARKSDPSTSLTRRVLSVKESYFTGGEEESSFIEIKFDSSGRVVNDSVLEHGGGGSCWLRTTDRELNSSQRSFKGWKWIFGHHHHHLKGS